MEINKKLFVKMHKILEKWNSIDYLDTTYTDARPKLENLLIRTEKICKELEAKTLAE